jgi:hypothetical protein
MTTSRETPSTSELSDIEPPDVPDDSVAMAGPPVPPAQRVYFYSSDEWENFIREWATGLEIEYVQIKRLGGAGDRSADIAGFKTADGFEGAWDCFQGKHYATRLALSDAAPELLKVFMAVLDGVYTMPDTYQFLAPQGCGTTLNRLLSKPTELKDKFLAKLVDGDPLVSGIPADRLAAIRALASETDFSRFRSVELVDVLETHRRTPYHAARFGTALAPRPVTAPPPLDLAVHETRYVEQLLAVYQERHPADDVRADNVSSNPRVAGHFQRQRESFYKAEALRVYARDAVPPGTYEQLQDDIHSGVIDTAEADHPTGWDRLTTVLGLVGQLDLQRHRLISVADIDDRKGVCHQLANTDRLVWLPTT